MMTYISSIQFNHLCQIWDLESWQCVKSLQVPAYIIKAGKQFLPAIDNSDFIGLSSVHHINSDIECLILDYDGKGGLLTLENYDLQLWYDQDKLKKNFFPFPSLKIIEDLFSVADIAVSDNQQFIAIRKHVS